MLIIPLRFVRYSDTRSILNAYTRENGRLSFLIPDGTGTGLARRRALFQPLFPIDAIIESRPDTEFARIKEPHPAFPLYGLASNPVKQTVTLFIAEVLSSLLRHPEPDPVMFDFLIYSIRTLENADTHHVANFHLVFLYRLTEFLGIKPDAACWSQGKVFDLRDSVFRSVAPLHNDYLSPQNASLIPLIDRLDYRTMPLLRLSRLQRNKILDTILHYYGLHDFPIHPLRSLDIFRSLF